MAALLSAAPPRWSAFTQQGAALRPRQRRRVTVCAQDGSGDRDGGSQTGQDAPTTPPAATPPPPRPLTNPAAMAGSGGLRLPPARRLVVRGLAATAIVLGGNLFGVTSWLLGRDGGQLAEQLRLDVLVPVNGYRRCLDVQNGFSFLYPAKWLADQTLYRRYAERIERQAALDPPSLQRPGQRSRRVGTGSVPEPAAAYGPAGSTGEENMSVVCAPIRDGFTLQKMGSPEEAATMFLQNTVAPEGSGRTAVLLGAGSRRDAGGELYYWQEFTVQSQRFFRHNLAVYAARNGLLYTLNCQCPEGRWAQNEAAFRRAAESFTLLDSGAATAGFPDRL